MRELGQFLGWFTITFFSLAFLNPIVKFVQKNWGKILFKRDSVKKPWQIFMRFILTLPQLKQWDSWVIKRQSVSSRRV
jgi:hypothetical protein